jgi:ParB family chromosome partitioning protein
MKITKIPLDKLIAHPANANVMSEEFLVKLKRQIAEQQCYEPLVVRRHPQRAGCYQILNGHHRKGVLEQLQHTEADCVVWEVSDEQSLMLLATLNRLCGQDEPRRRAQLLEKLSRRFAEDDLLGRLPERREQLQKMLELNNPPRLTEPEDLGEMPGAMIFFVSRKQRKMIDEALKAVGKQLRKENPDKRINRGEVLCQLAQRMIGI